MPRVLLLVLAMHAPALQAQPPAIARDGVRNAASRLPPSLPRGGLAPGARIVIRGVGFGSRKEQAAVALDRPGARLNLILEAVSADHIEARLPPNLASGDYLLTVRSGALTSPPAQIRVMATAPGLYASNGQGWGPGRIANIDASGKRTENSMENPARPGRRVAVRSTGAGRNPVVTIAGRVARPAEVRPAADGEELMFDLPRDTPEGCFVPVSGANTVTLSIRGGGGPCRLADYFPYWRPGRDAMVLLVRMVYQDLDNPREVTRDDAIAQFLDVKAGDKFPGPLLFAPPDGLCAAYAGDTEAGKGAELLPLLFAGANSGEGLDAGPYLVIHDGRSQKRVTPKYGVEGLYEALLGNDDESIPPRRRLPLWFGGGRFAIAGYGGKDVGSWHVTLPAPAGFRWSNRGQAAVVTRGQPLPIEWEGAPVSQRVMIVVGTYDSEAQVNGFCQCMPGPAERRMTIPAAALEGLPNGPGYVWLVGLPDQPPAAIPATGLSQSAAISVFCLRREFRFVSQRP